MNGLIIATQKLLALPAEDIQSHILQNFGIDSQVKVTRPAVCITVKHWNSCFDIMRKLRYDFDYDILKRGKNYTLCIPR